MQPSSEYLFHVTDVLSIQLLVYAFILTFQSRQELEQHSVDTASTSDAVTFITYVQALKRKIKQFEKQVDVSVTIDFIHLISDLSTV